MQIKLNSRLGSIALAISATLRNDKVNEAARLAMGQLLFHNAGSKAFSGKDDGWKRDAAFSDALATHVKGTVAETLGTLFEGVSIETSPYVKQSPVDRLAKQMRELGMSEVDIAEVVAKAQNGKAEPAKVEAAKDDETVG